MRFLLSFAVIGWSLCSFAAGRCAFAAGPGQLPTQGQHRILTDNTPPGGIGGALAASRVQINGYVQPVSFHGPKGVQFSLPAGGAFGHPAEKFWAGLTVGGVYRFRITGIPRRPGAELYPTIEIIDRTYPPPGLAMRYPVQVHLDHEDIRLALQGQMVTRIIYLEDTETASPIEQNDDTRRPVEVAEYQDALEVADRLGRPVAIVRIGSMLPPRQMELMPRFCLGFPTWYPIFFPESDTATEQMTGVTTGVNP